MDGEARQQADAADGESRIPHYVVNPPGRRQLGLAVVNLLIPPVLLGWAYVNGHAMFFEWQTLGAMGLLVAMGVDTFYQRWVASTYTDIDPELL